MENMKNLFANVVKKETSLSEVMQGRTKVDTKELITKYSDGVTLTEFDFITLHDAKKGDSCFPVLAIAEDPEVCFFGGAVLSNICKGWADAFQGDVEKASTELSNCGGVKVKMTEGRTKSGNNLVKVEFVG